MRIMRIGKAPFESNYKKRIAQLCLVFPYSEEIGDKRIRRVMFDDGEDDNVAYVHLIPYKGQLPKNDNRVLLEKDMETAMFRINFLSSKILRIERSPEYRMMIKTEDEKLEAMNNDIRLMEKEVEDLWKGYHYNKFWKSDIDSEEKLLKAGEVWSRKLKKDFWDSDFKPLPKGEVQTLF